MPTYCNSFMMEWGGWVCGISMVLFWIFSFVLFFTFLKKICPYFCEKSDQEDNMDNIKEILKSRYANGEIDRAEFLEKKKDLEVWVAEACGSSSKLKG